MAIVCALAAGPIRADTVARTSPAAASLARGEAAREAGDYAGSIRLLGQALVQAKADKDTPESLRADILEGLGESLRLAGRYTPSGQRLAEAVSAHERASGPQSVEVARARRRLAEVRLQQEAFDDARAELERARAIVEAVPGPLLERAAVYDSFATLSSMSGRYDDADEWSRRAIAEVERAGGADSALMAFTLRHRAIVLTRMGKPDEAWALMRRALDLVHALRPPSHPELAGYANDAANIAWYRGDAAAARPLWEEALRIGQASYGPKSLICSTYLGNLAVLARHYGDTERALRLQREARDIVASALGPTHNYVGYRLWQIAGTEIERGRPAAARALLEQSLRILERSLGPAHSMVVDARVELARLAIDTGDLDAAAKQLAVVDRIGDAGKLDEVSHFRATYVRGALALAEGRLESASASFAEAARGYAEAYGPAHPELALVRARLADVAWAQGDAPRAARLASDAETLVRDHLRLAMRALSERLALSYAATRPRALDVLLSAAGASRDAAVEEAAFDGLVRSRGIVLDELVQRRRPLPDAGPEAAKLVDAFAAARSRWANLAVRSRGREYDAILEKARDEQEHAEEALAARSASFRREQAQRDVDASAVRRALPADAALVSFVRYARAAAPGGEGTAPRPAVPSYLAIVSRREGAPKLVELGDAASIDRLVEAWRRHFAAAPDAGGQSPREAERRYRRSGDALRARIWDPLQPLVAGAARVLVVPDGTLHVVGLASLPVGGDRYLAESGVAFQYLTTERDVAAPPSTSPANQGLLAIGGVAFGGAAAAGTTRGAATAAGEICIGLDDVSFFPLPATAREARDVARLWRASGAPADVLSAAAASEGRLRQLAPHRRVLHLATHGFFLDATCRTAPPATGASPAGRASAPPGRAVRTPLALSGLALAGANRRASVRTGENDGILTAEEVATLDLDGVEWVVLSACDTALGPISAGEGVLGLRRAFQIAGARTVIMSLWSIDDEAAAAWMTHLYRRRLVDRLETDAAIRDATVDLLEARRRARTSTHPFYWAAFVAAGDWR